MNMIKIIEIEILSNGAHSNQTGDFKIIPEGWAVIPDKMETPNFPFGDIEVKEIDGVMTVTKWTAREIPETPTAEPEPTTDEVLNALLGVSDNE